MKRITLLGATGSIGRNCLEVIRAHPQDFKIIGLSTHHRVDLLYQQCQEFRPVAVCITGDNFPLAVLDQIAALGIEIMTGEEGLLELVHRYDVDVLVNGLVGISGLHATLAAIKGRTEIALANKELLVMAGGIIMSLADIYGVRILPIDSEHSAIFQCLQGENPSQIHRVILTASGGPFQKYSPEQLAQVTVEQAVQHPNWFMGRNISIDAATLMNKGFEVIETHWLFGVPGDRIEVVIHPESIIHSMVEFVDGAIKAQMAVPDIRQAIQYALTYPERKPLECQRVSFDRIRQLSFEPPDLQRFPALKLAYEALKLGGTAPAVLNAANDRARQAFIEKQIKFTQIPNLVEQALDQHKVIENPGLEDLLASDIWARNFVDEIVQQQQVLVVSF
ncbi:MAG: 1-deoxy-D-xylulose-5-phosphate reductoisomerase [candidate division KSB1 bacterium]|nr:1-deoxy-D-xylulose-5-phosphate reductoisomerase [candidate division KSB1 bacterium]